MYNNIARAPFTPEEWQPLSFRGFPFGLNTNLRGSLLNTKELAQATNVMFRPGGKLVTRPVLEAVTTVAIGVPCDRKTGNITSGQEVFSADVDGKIYYDVGTVPTLIGTVGVKPFLLPYKGAMLIMDGGMLKYCDTTAEIKLAFDGGDTGTQYSVWDKDSFEDEDDGTTTGAIQGCRFTTKAWEAGYTIPITLVQFKVKATTGTSTDIVVKLKTTAGVEMASKALNQSVTDVAGYYSVSFTDDDITTELSPETEYDVTLEGTNFELSYSTPVISATGHSFNGTVVDTAKDPLMKIHPDVPPKASFGIITGKDSSARLFIYNPDEPGRAYYCNLTHKDWSTLNGGGYVGVVDEDKNSFKIGAFGILYGVLYVYGDESNPYLCVLTGATPVEYQVTPVFQHASANRKTLVNVNNDLLNASRIGVTRLKGVQESGDVRTFPITERIDNLINSYWDLDAFAGYDPEYGHYILKMTGYDRILIANTKQPFTEEGAEGRTGFPWSEFVLPYAPAYFSQYEEQFVMGMTNGLFYKFNSTGYKDLGVTALDINVVSNVYVFDGVDVDLEQYQLIATSYMGAQFDFKVLINENEDTYAFEDTKAVSMSDKVTVDDLADVEVDDWLSSIDPTDTRLFYPLNIACTAFQWQITNVKLVGRPLYIDGVTIKALKVES